MGSIDVLINNAGIWPTAYVVDMKPEDFERTIRVNLEVPYLLCQKFVQEKIAAQQKGKIVNIVSQAAFHGSTTGHAHYAAAQCRSPGTQRCTPPPCRSYPAPTSAAPPCTPV